MLYGDHWVCVAARTHLGGKVAQQSREAWLPDDEAPTLKRWGLFGESLPSAGSRGRKLDMLW